jgi:hypothetical protein
VLPPPSGPPSAEWSSLRRVVLLPPVPVSPHFSVLTKSAIRTLSSCLYQDPDSLLATTTPTTINWLRDERVVHVMWGKFAPHFLFLHSYLDIT